MGSLIKVISIFDPIRSLGHLHTWCWYYRTLCWKSKCYPIQMSTLRSAMFWLCLVSGVFSLQFARPTRSLKIWGTFSDISWIQTKNLLCGFMFYWKYEWICPTFLKSKPGVFQAVSCFMFNWNMRGSVRHFLNPNQEYFMWFHVWLKSQTYVTLFLNQWSMLVWHLKYEVCHQKIFLIFFGQNL